jgi:hypothetical protein
MTTLWQIMPCCEYMYVCTIQYKIMCIRTFDVMVFFGWGRREREENWWYQYGFFTINSVLDLSYYKSSLSRPKYYSIHDSWRNQRMLTICGDDERKVWLEEARGDRGICVMDCFGGRAIWSRNSVIRTALRVYLCGIGVGRSGSRFFCFVIFAFDVLG